MRLRLSVGLRLPIRLTVRLGQRVIAVLPGLHRLHRHAKYDGIMLNLTLHSLRTLVP